MHPHTCRESSCVRRVYSVCALWLTMYIFISILCCSRSTLPLRQCKALSDARLCYLTLLLDFASFTIGQFLHPLEYKHTNTIVSAFGVDT